MSEYDLSIHTNPDAVAWAKFFMETMKNNPDYKIDEEIMIGWFSNAMMAMHDHLMKVENKKLRTEVMSDYYEGWEEGVKAERERCAKIADQLRDETCDGPVAWSMADGIAAAILESK